jgi:purine-nucleoside phosphorylase
MSVHLSAKPGDIADVVLLPGDPLRARHIAETYFTDPVCYNEVRGMYGFTGTYRGKRVSVQGTGMGMPSIAIYVQELIQEYGAKTLIRVGTCGGLRDEVKVRDLVLASAACTDSNMIRQRFPGFDFVPAASFRLLHAAYEAARERGWRVHVGSVLTTDLFYREDREPLRKLAAYGVQAVEMETAALYLLAARHQVDALSILTVSDHLFSGEADTSAEERQTAFGAMVELALDVAVRTSHST